MHASCAICGDLFTGVHPEILHSTSCGHIFHYECLLEWLQRSKTCPTCRAKVSETNTIRLYFQLNMGGAQDTCVLENKIQSLSFQLAIKEADFKKLVEEATKLKEQNKLLRHSVRKAEEQARCHETVVSSLQDQLKTMKSQMKNLKETQLKVEELEAKLEQYKSLENILKGSITDAAETLELMKDITDTSVLCACINTLKREMYTLREKSRDYQCNLRAKDSKMLQMNIEITSLQEKLSILERSLHKVKDELAAAETENRSLREKDKLKKPIDNTCSTRNDLYTLNNRSSRNVPIESPAPSRLRNSSDMDSLQSSLSLETEFTPSPLKLKFLSNKTDKLLLNKPKLKQFRSFSSLTNDIPDGFGGYGALEDDSDKQQFKSSVPSRNEKLPSKRIKLTAETLKNNNNNNNNSISKFFTIK